MSAIMTVTLYDEDETPLASLDCATVQVGDEAPVPVDEITTSNPYGVETLRRAIFSDFEKGEPLDGLAEAEAEADCLLRQIQNVRRRRRTYARARAFEAVHPIYSETLYRLVEVLEAVDGGALGCPTAVQRALDRARTWAEGVAIHRAAGTLSQELDTGARRRDAAGAIHDEGAGILDTLGTLPELEEARQLTKTALSVFRAVGDLVEDPEEGEIR